MSGNLIVTFICVTKSGEGSHFVWQTWRSDLQNMISLFVSFCTENYILQRVWFTVRKPSWNAIAIRRKWREPLMLWLQQIPRCLSSRPPQWAQSLPQSNPSVHLQEPALKCCSLSTTTPALSTTKKTAPTGTMTGLWMKDLKTVVTSLCTTVRLMITTGMKRRTTSREKSQLLHIKERTYHQRVLPPNVKGRWSQVQCLL